MGHYGNNGNTCILNLMQLPRKYFIVQVKITATMPFFLIRPFSLIWAPLTILIFIFYFIMMIIIIIYQFYGKWIRIEDITILLQRLYFLKNKKWGVFFFYAKPCSNQTIVKGKYLLPIGAFLFSLRVACQNVRQQIVLSNIASHESVDAHFKYTFSPTLT